MIIKFRLDTNAISSWGYHQADDIYVHKKYGNEIKSPHSFYATKKIKSLDYDEVGGKHPIVYWILLNKHEKDIESCQQTSIVIPVSGSEIYLLTDEGKTIERLN